jgi:hypothetical protein
MDGQSELDLDQVPRRFWTPQMIEMAQDQGRFDVAITIVDELLEQAPDSQRPELEALSTRARRGLASMERKAHLSQIRKHLDICLKRAVAFKKATSSDYERTP